MDEVWLRLALIAGALGVAAMATIALRWRATGRPRTLSETGLEPGVYLFTSAACPDCAFVRKKLTDRIGIGGFKELAWEEEPGEFHRLGVDAVPATLVVDEDGSATLWPGRARDLFESLGP